MPRHKRDQAARFIELKRQIIATTGLPEEAPRVAYLAVLALRAERITESAINGDDIDVAELLALKDTVEQMSPAPPHTVVLEISGRLHGICPHCHRSTELDEAVPGPGPTPNRDQFVPPDPLLLLPPADMSGNGADNG
jgi:hypothetical protein